MYKRQNDYLAAKFTAAEWAEAFARDPSGAGGVLLPVRVGDCRPEGLLRTIAYVDLLGLDEATAKRTLLARVKGERLKPSSPPVFPCQVAQRSTAAPIFPADEAPATLRALRQALGDGQTIPELSVSALQAILRHVPSTLDDYRLARIAAWSQPRHALDRRFPQHLIHNSLAKGVGRTKPRFG